MKRPIIDELIRYIDKNEIPYSMPGHKRGRAFDENFKKILLYGDITEIDGLDNLHKPEGCIKESLLQLKNVYKSYKSYFLINGSSSGNIIMLNSFFEEGDKIIVERNCHKSIFNGIFMKKLSPVYIKNKYSSKLNIYAGIELDELVEILNNNKDIKGIILTYPNYYGICCDIERIIYECKKRNVLVLVDAAHGAHFTATSSLPKDPVMLGADCVVMSAHKTLPALTQTSYMHLNNKNFEKKIDLYFSLLSSTSPSYIFMASLEYAYTFLNDNGKESYDSLVSEINSMKKEFKNDKLNILDDDIINSEFGEGFTIDNSRIVINLYNSVGEKLYNYLKSKGIQPEMYDENNVVIITTPFNYTEEIVYLKNILLDFKYDIKEEKKEYKDNKYEDIYEEVNFKEVLESNTVKVNLKDSIGRIVANNIIPYPPGIPLLVIGERILEKHINSIETFINQGITVIGVENKEIDVIEE